MLIVDERRETADYVSLMDLREKVRAWLIDAKVGLIDSAELTDRADRAIGEIDNPPDYLIALSLGEPLRHVARLDLVKDRISVEDLGGLAVRLLDRLASGDISLDQVAAVAARLSFPRHDNEMIDAWAQFCWITDEQDLIDQGVKDGANFKDGVIEALRKIAANVPM